MSNLTPEERELYDSDLKAKSDYYASIQYAADKAAKEAKEEGKKERDLEIAKELMALELPVDKIAKATGLTIQQIEDLKS